MESVKNIWIVIAILSIIFIIIHVNVNMTYVESAMQASQLYNEATAFLLGIISFSLLLLIKSYPNMNLEKEFQKKINDLVNSNNSISDELKEIKQLIKDSGISTNIPLKIPGYQIKDTPSVNEPIVKTQKDDSNIPICPNCLIPMKVRTATKGKYSGKQFYVCPNYPNCKEVRRIN